MAKNQPKAPVAARAPRAKTPAQIAVRDRNIEAAAKRLAAQQARAKVAKQLRERYPELTGTVDQIVDTYLEFVEKEVADMLAAKVQAAIAAVRGKYVEEALAGPSACHLTRFLAGRAATFERVDAFFVKSGLPRVAPLAAKTAA